MHESITLSRFGCVIFAFTLLIGQCPANASVDKEIASHFRGAATRLQPSVPVSLGKLVGLHTAVLGEIDRLRWFRSLDDPHPVTW